MPKLSYKAKTYPAKHPTRVCFFYAGFMTKTWNFLSVYRKLNKLGYTVVAYQFPGRPLLNKDNDFLDGMRYDVQADVQKRITAYKKQGIKEFASFSLSMGSVYNIAIAKHTPDIKRIVVVTIYGSGAKQIWDEAKLKRMKNLYISRGLTMEQLAAKHRDAEAAMDLDKLSGRKVLVYASRTDKTILIENTQLFIDNAKTAGLDIQTIIGTGGHIPYITRILMRDKRWQKFLQ